VGSFNLYDSGSTTATSIAVKSLSTNGETVYPIFIIRLIRPDQI